MIWVILASVLLGILATLTALLTWGAVLYWTAVSQGMLESEDDET